MFSFSKLYLATSFEDAYSEFIKNKKNIILGGTSYLRMGNVTWNTAIDLSNLETKYILENEDTITLGCMTTFRDLETSSLLKTYFGDLFKDALKDIIGVQFRSNVTVGATVFSKYGFSDLIPALLALDSKVSLVNGGVISLVDFLKETTFRRDILKEIIIPKQTLKTSFKCVRKSKTDYSIINMVITLDSNNKFTVTVGARPGKAVLATTTMEILNSSLDESNIKKAVNNISSEISVDDNMRGSKEYRMALLPSLLSKGIQEVLG